MNEAKTVRELARIEGYHRGIALTYQDVARHCPGEWRPRFIAEQCELAGWPVWTSAPDEAWKP